MFAWILDQIGNGCLAAVFALAVMHKVRNYPRFVVAMNAYGIVPVSAVQLAAPCLLLGEVFAIACLFIPVGPGSFVAFSLLGAYTVAIGLNLARGRRNMDCGCGGKPMPLSGWLLVRNGVLLLLAWPYRIGAPPVEVPGAAWLVVAAGILLTVLAYLAAEQLLANTNIEDLGVG